MSDLDRLIEAVESGDCPWLPEAFGDSWFSGDTMKDAESAFNGSLDAAKALHDALLPGWEWRGRNDGRWWVWLTAADLQWGDADNPARAWLIAILKAYRSLQWV